MTVRTLLAALAPYADDNLPVVLADIYGALWGVRVEKDDAVRARGRARVTLVAVAD